MIGNCVCCLAGQFRWADLPLYKLVTEVVKVSPRPFVEAFGHFVAYLQVSLLKLGAGDTASWSNQSFVFCPQESWKIRFFHLVR